MNNVMVSLDTTPSITPSWIRPGWDFLLLLFIKNGIEYHKRSDLQFTTLIMVSWFIEIDKDVFKSSNNIIIGVVHTPPLHPTPNTDIDTFSDHMSNIVSIFKTERKSCYLLGDFNLNLWLYSFCSLNIPESSLTRLTIYELMLAAIC